MIAEQRAKREQTHPVSLHVVEKCRKVERVTRQNDYETTTKKWTDKKKANLFCEFCKSVSIPRKQVQDRSKEILGNDNKKDCLENPLDLTIITR